MLNLAQLLSLYMTVSQLHNQNPCVPSVGGHIKLVKVLRKQYLPKCWKSYSQA